MEISTSNGIMLELLIVIAIWFYVSVVRGVKVIIKNYDKEDYSFITLKEDPYFERVFLEDNNIFKFVEDNDLNTKIYSFYKNTISRNLINNYRAYILEYEKIEFKKSIGSLCTYFNMLHNLTELYSINSEYMDYRIDFVIETYLLEDVTEIIINNAYDIETLYNVYSSFDGVLTYLSLCKNNEAFVTVLKIRNSLFDKIDSIRK